MPTEDLVLLLSEYRAPHDERFARRLFDPAFLSRVRASSWPIIPRTLAGDREDLIDKALLRAYERRCQFRGSTDEDLNGWVQRILLNLTRDTLRRNEPRLEHLSSDGLVTESPVGHRDDGGGMMSGIFAWLLPADRDVLRLRLGMNLSVRETAELLTRGGDRVTEAAVKMRLARAVRRLAAAADRSASSSRCLSAPSMNVGPE